MNTFSLKLIACDKVFYDGPCEILIFDGFDGEMAIMANHEPMTCSVETGELRFRVPGETTWQEAIVSTGLLKVEHNKVDIIVYSAERPEEIDKFRAGGYGAGVEPLALCPAYPVLPEWAVHALCGVCAHGTGEEPHPI